MRVKDVYAFLCETLMYRYTKKTKLQTESYNIFERLL